MIKSMTGFGSGQSASKTISVELKSVNNRFFEIQIKGPRHFNSLDIEMRALVQKNIARGSVFLSILWDESKNNDATMRWDKKKTRAAVTALKEIQKTHGLEKKLTLQDVLAVTDVSASEPRPDPKKQWPEVKKALTHALTALEKMRVQEGKALEKDILGRLKKMSQVIVAMEKRAPQRKKEYLEKTQNRLKEFLKQSEIDETRILTETLLWSDRTDISEEITRFKSHLTQFNDTLKKEKAEPGKKLNFILQEMNRESNTIGSKANDLILSQKTIELKEEIEKIREQIQNIE